MAMETTAEGIDAETVIPAKSPRYALAAPRTTERMMLRIVALSVTSGSRTDAGI
jgi:hypothetical protein